MYVLSTHYVDENKIMKIIPETVFREQMRNCSEFIDDVTVLQTNHWNMGEHVDHIIIKLTHKCHPEIVVEVIGSSGRAQKIIICKFH